MAHLLNCGNPTAVFCANDDMALGAMAEARARGLSVPTDISVVGFDDLPYAAFFDPALTTVSQPRRRFGELAADALIKGQQGRRTRLDYTMQIRSSAVPLSPRQI
jgi:LacI family repressor for deo operon, udp, cdd, tsx, nupC, and nupG